ncbi:Ribonuclease P protein subunit p21 [Gonapodya sp. JEL0774]|nr:Ribonuclease P protein subunit p21 [Gonapodya sp. JEL0774]
MGKKNKAWQKKVRDHKQSLIKILNAESYARLNYLTQLAALATATRVPNPPSDIPAASHDLRPLDGSKNPGTVNAGGVGAPQSTFQMQHGQVYTSPSQSAHHEAGVMQGSNECQTTESNPLVSQSNSSPQTHSQPSSKSHVDDRTPPHRPSLENTTNLLLRLPKKAKGPGKTIRPPRIRLFVPRNPHVNPTPPSKPKTTAAVGARSGPPGDPLDNSLAGLGSFYLATMKTITERLVLRVDPSLKRTICRRCGVLLLPGASATVSVGTHPSAPHPHLSTTCRRCLKVRRLVLEPAAELWAEYGPVVGEEESDEEEAEEGGENNGTKMKTDDINLE